MPCQPLRDTIAMRASVPCRGWQSPILAAQPCSAQQCACAVISPPGMVHRLRHFSCAAASSEGLKQPAESMRAPHQGDSRRRCNSLARWWRLRPSAADIDSADNSQLLLEADESLSQSSASKVASVEATASSTVAVDDSPVVQPSTDTSSPVQTVESEDTAAASTVVLAEPVGDASGRNGVAAVLAEGSSMVRELLGSILPDNPSQLDLDTEREQKPDGTGSREQMRPMLDSDAAADSAKPSTSGRSNDSQALSSNGASAQQKRRSRSGLPAWPMATVLFDMGGGAQARSMRKGIVRRPRSPQQPLLDASLFSAATARARDIAGDAFNSRQSEAAQDAQLQAEAGDGVSWSQNRLDRASRQTMDGSNPAAPGQASKPSLLDAAADAAAKLLQLTNGALTPQPEPQVNHWAPGTMLNSQTFLRNGTDPAQRRPRCCHHRNPHDKG